MGFKKLVLMCSSLFLVFSLSACTSSQTDDANAGAEVSDESLEMAEAIDDNSDLNADLSADSLDLDGGGDAFADLGDSDMNAPTDVALDDTSATPADITEDTSLAETAPEGAPVEELAPDFGAPTEDTSVADTTEEATPDFGDSTDVADSSATPAPSYDGEVLETESTEFTDTSSSSSGGVVSLKKMISVPYMHAGKPVNGLYMAREGDTIESISQKIFGGDRVAELCAINAYNCSRGVKVGDKYYYNSPQRPTDTENVKTFYEDAGIPAQNYVAQSGDNIRTLGKTLLGNERSWMELWSTNMDVESKGELSEGTSLRYWPSSAVSIPSLAQTPSEPMPPAPSVTEEMEIPSAPSDVPSAPDMAMGDVPPPPTDAMDMNDSGGDDFNQAENLPAEPMNMGSVEPPPPPPPPPPPVDMPPSDMAATEDMDPDQTMALGVGAILLLAGVALFIAIRKKKSRRTVDFNTTTQTQID